jgi:hypothetical protein
MTNKYRSWAEAEQDAPIFTMENLPIMMRQYAFRELEGRLLTLVESMGLNDKREGIIKQYVRRELWDTVHQMGYIIPTESDEELTNNIGSTPEQLGLETPKKKSRK